MRNFLWSDHKRHEQGDSPAFAAADFKFENGLPPGRFQRRPVKRRVKRPLVSRVHVRKGSRGRQGVPSLTVQPFENAGGGSFQGFAPGLRFMKRRGRRVQLQLGCVPGLSTGKRPRRRRRLRLESSS